MRVALLALLTLALAVAGCSDSGESNDSGDDGQDDGPGSSTANGSQTTAPPMAAPAPQTHESVMRSNLFEPSDFTLRVGDTIHWTTEDVQMHNVVSDSEAGAFRSEDVSIVPVLFAQEFSYTFTTAGTVDYLCEYHNGMVGTVVVEA